MKRTRNHDRNTRHVTFEYITIFGNVYKTSLLLAQAAALIGVAAMMAIPFALVWAILEAFC